MSFPRYERYKDSGVDWLGEVPAHWEIAPVRFVVTHVDKRNDGALCQDYLSLLANVGVVPYEEKGDIGNKKPEDLSKCKLVETGDIVINSMNYSIGSYGMSSYGGVCSPVYVVLRVIEAVVSRPFIFRLLQNTAFQKYAASLGNGILAHRAAIGWDDLKAIGIALPPRNEQDFILYFLAQETAKIDALIEEQRRLIALLKEKRQAVISHAVTKGLNPDVPMKDSGIEPLGVVPNHWDLLRIKYFARLQRGYDLTAEEQEEGSFPVVTSGGVMGSHSKYMTRGPGVVTGRYGSTGRLFFVEDHFWPHNTTLFVSDFFGNDERFVWYAFQAVDFSAHSVKSAVPGIDRNDIHPLPIAVPGRSEQEAIVAYLDKHMETLVRLEQETESTIKLLQERRSALISAAVTGKIDVRNYAAQDIADAEELYAPA